MVLIITVLSLEWAKTKPYTYWQTLVWVKKSGSLQYKKNKIFLFVIIKVNNTKMKTYAEQDKEKLKEDTRNCYYLKNDKEK